MGAIYLDANTESDIYGTGNSVAGTVLGSGAINVTETAVLYLVMPKTALHCRLKDGVMLHAVQLPREER